MSYPDQLDVLAGSEGVGTGGIPSGFVVFAVLAALVSAGIFVWRVALARRMAHEAGMDPGRATAVTLLDDSGLGATYVASSLRPSRSAKPTAAPSVRSVNERLRELEELKVQELVFDEEYRARRTAIIDSL